MITSRGDLSMQSPAFQLDKSNGVDGSVETPLSDVTGQSNTGNSNTNSNCNSNHHNGNHYNHNHNCKHNNINETALWSRSHDMKASKPVLRNINTDMTKGIQRKSHQGKMQFTGNDRDAKQQLANDDLRMSKIMRRLHNESSPAAALELCSKLEMAVRTPVNMGYLTRSFDVILDGMLALFKQCPPLVVEECCKTLGLIGYINRMSYPIYEEFIVKNYRTNKKMQKYLIVALRTTLSCDHNKCDLHIYADKIMHLLKDFLEAADNPDNFIAISECIVQFSHNYRDAFECHFTNVVDIIIGWQLEIGQPKQLKAHCAYVLEQLTPYFSNQLNFSYGLLHQFIEDIQTELDGERIGAFVGAFNTLLKCLTRMRITCESIVYLALSHLTKMLPDVLMQLHHDNNNDNNNKVGDDADDTNNSNNDALININELFCICLLNGYSEPDAATLNQLIHLQFVHITKLRQSQQLSCMYLLLCTVRKLRARLPNTLVQLIFQSESPFLAEIRVRSEHAAYKLLLRCCQETLLIRNVPLLQLAYKQLVADIDNCMSRIADAPMETNASALLTFQLAALASLAKQTASIIGMYACKPSILQLLIDNCRAEELIIWSKHSSSHQAIIALLIVHCQANHNFRKNSSLLCDGNDNIISQPTAHSFGHILKFLAHCLSKQAVTQLSPLNLQQLLNWTSSLLAECATHSTMLLLHGDFRTICDCIASVTPKYAPMESGQCMLAVLGYGCSNLSRQLLELYRDTALQQLKALCSSSIHSIYAQIYAQLPLHLTIVKRCAIGIGCSTHVSIWQQRLSQCSAVRDNVFRDFVERLQTPEEQPLPVDGSLRALFVRSCQVNVLDERQEKLTQCTRRCQCLASAWLQHEAARYCLDQKLRTTLGKPQDTFLAIEAIVMRYARLLNGCAKDAERQTFDEMSLQQLCNTQANLSMLLGFLDALEKHIYNAAEGSAFALRAPEKPVSAFFRLNNPTCQSWFNRTRIGVVIIAMHCQQPELAVRYAQEILQTPKSQDCSLHSQAIVYLAWAHIHCGESDALRGLHVWARSKSEKSYQWLLHASDQAAGRRDQALAGYRNVLDDEQQAAELEPHTRQFVLSQLIECLHSTGQWAQSVNLKLQLKRNEEHADIFNPFLQRSSVQVSAMESLLSKYDGQLRSDELNAALHNLSIWPTGELAANQQKQPASFAASYVHDKLEQAVLRQTLDPHEMFEMQQSLLDTNWRESLLNTSHEQGHWQQLTLLQHIVAQRPEHEHLTLLPLDREDALQQSCITSSLLLRCMAWTQLLRRNCVRDTEGTLHVDTAMLAREEGNHLTSQAILEQYFGEPLTQIAGQLLRQPLDTTDDQLLRGYSEMAKCLHQSQQQPQLHCTELSSINICAALCLNIQKQQQEQQQQVGAELLLTLSDWISARSCSGLATNMSATLQQLLDQLPECPLTSNSNSSSSNSSNSSSSLLQPHGERVVARLIYASLQQRPDNEEALIAYGNWCYRWGKKIVDNGCILSPVDINAISSELGGGTDALDNDTLQELMQALRMESPPGSSCEETDLQTDAQCEQRLRRLELLAHRPPSTLDMIVRIWRRAMAQTFDYYKAAAHSYFHYLSLKGSGTQQSRFHVDDSNMVTTTLRLLRLIVKHASGLQDVLEQGLKTTPIGPWKVIIPQLFSRLNHHEPYVRQSVCALLCRLAESRPQLVTFPAVVGANRELQATPLTSTSTSTGTGSGSDSSSPATESSYASLLSALTKQSPEVVQHVQLLVKELRRVCLLWDEYWIHSLAHIYNSYVGRVHSMASEFKPDDLEGKQNRFDSWRPQLLQDLEALIRFTAREPETSYERNFKRRFDAPIKHTLDALRHQPYPEAWDKLKQLYHILQSNMLRGTSNTLKMRCISPVLCEIGRMSISMPGLDAQDELQPIVIDHVESTVCILPTKTKPKKVAFYGSNGQKYTFLFKGLEDLHLDERIMQFLSISNAIMASKNDTPNSCYRAHHYSVIPLGPQSGLISWVDGVTPLFALYKKWQQRQPDADASASSRRLTDFFYSKLSPLLAKHNMLVTDPRRQWPLSVLRQVLNELMQETPKDLLARELWCQAGCAAEWRQSVRRYTSCMAVMSVIGYVIGLGDRHLDNVLINLRSGDIVHIDYNVCFEKGRTLRIPERVPFRLTQNMVHALGITGIEGSFRLGCEYVLKVMRKERETLLTLLEAFVYDPLVDWTINDDAAALRRAVNAKPSSTASNEMKCLKKDKSKNKLHDWDAKRRHLVGKLNQCQKFWSSAKLKILPQLSEMVVEIGKLQQMQAQRLSADQELVNLNKRSALIAEINSLGTAIESHSFNTASSRYAIKRRHEEMLAEQTVQCRADYERVQCLLASYNQCLQQSQLIKFSACLVHLKLVAGNWNTNYDQLQEQVHGHLPGDILEELNSTRHRLGKLSVRLSDLGLQCVEHMLQYASIMFYYPMQANRKNKYVRFRDTYAQHLRHMADSSCGSVCSNSNSIAPSPMCHINVGEQLKIVETLETVWVQLTCQLYELQQQVSNVAKEPQPQSVDTIQESNFSQMLHNAALIHTMDEATAAFTNYEKSALATHDTKLTQQQLQFIKHVRTMCRKLAGDSVHSVQSEQAREQLSELDTALDSLIKLQSFFREELPVSIFRLLLLSPNLDDLTALLQLSSKALSERYSQALSQHKEQEEHHHLPEEKSSVPLPTVSDQFMPCLQSGHEQFEKLDQFMLCLQSGHEQFEKLTKALERIERTIKLIIDDIPDDQTQQYMELSILKNASREHLSGAVFFELVLQTLRSSQSYNIRLMGGPVHNFMHRLQQDYIVGLVPLLSYAFYTNCGTRCHELAALSDCPTQLLQLCDGFFASLQAKATLLQQKRDISQLSQQIETLTLIASAHYWAYGELLDYELSSPHIISRQTLCKAIYENWQTLDESSAVMEQLVHQLNSQLEQLQGHRSNWNRNHIDSLLRIDERLHKRTLNHLDMIGDVSNCASALCSIEQMGTIGQESQQQQQQLPEHMESWLQCYAQWQESNARISAVEQAVVQLLDPEGGIDQCWLTNVQGLLEDYTCKVQREISTLETEQQTRHTFICTLLKDILRQQEHMPRIYMRNMCAELEDQTSGSGKLIPLDVQLLCGHVRDSQRKLLNFFQLLVELRKDLSGDRHAMQPSTLASWQQQLLLIQEMINHDVDDFFKSIDEFLQHAADGDSLPYETFTHNKGAPNSHEQKRNAYGVSVWKKIRMKLEGRDPDSNQRSTIAEQVDYVIREATNPDNLAILYEGWTPWV
ncbi:serine/threonine-protein kinase Smg1 [Drosophila grimshawi]|uniref:serine/threonine-protein kinase Smg1 n=1 Tax=Drosophila grimshawi TaxID=7222 RepID=UPI000C86E629|nr:serine/threonine-protein kinase Smg1 [Drosophila grimshawi]